MIDIKTLREATKSLTVLYVEDELDIQQSMSRYLKKFFHRVDIASDGEEGLKFFLQQEYDLVITDLSMPKMDGIEMIHKIREHNEQQVILVTTAHSEKHYMFSALKGGVDGYIIKPFEFTQLNEEIYKTTNKILALHENEQYKEHLKNIVKQRTHELENLVDVQNDNYDKTLYSMVEMIERRDTYTAGHSKRVAEYSKRIAQAMGYSKETCTLLYQAGVLHDIGKIATPDSILLNPKKLNDIEYTLIQEHVTVSYQLLKGMPMFKQLAEIVYVHHEKYDGSGYPQGLKGDAIPPLGRIMILADAFDAMTTNRIYKGRKSVEEALQEIQKLSAIHYHPKEVEAACNALKGVQIDTTVNQLPKSKLEEERFAYFYKDILSEVYNQNYLDVVLMKNFYEMTFKYMEVVSLKKFSLYNKEHGWKVGDELLKTLGNNLYSQCKESFVFRIFGDDFIILSKNLPDITYTQKILDETLEDKNLAYKLDFISLVDSKIRDVSEIEAIQST